MPDGFKLLDAYVEVKANATGIGEKISKAFAGEVAPAAKKMGDAVEAATARVAAASKRQADAAASLRLAQMRLTEVQKTAAEGSVQLVSAQERLASAQRNVVAASDSAGRAQKSLATAQRTAGESAGGGFLSGLKGAISIGAVGGFVGGITSTVTSGVVSLISSAVSDIGGMLETVGRDIATTVIDFNSELQNANIGFTTMLGSGAKAKSFLSDLKQFAKVTPFDFGGLVANAQNMMGMGIAARDVIPDLRALGDSVASVGGSASQVDQVTLAFDQMSAKGTLDMGNMNQLMQGGVPSALKIMAAAYHTTTGKMIGMISTGKVQASVALPALVKGIEKGTKATAALGGMMDKQSSTFTGALSNIQDGLTQTVSQAFKPFFDVASKGMLQFANALSGKPAQKFTKDVTRELKPFATEIGKWFKTVDLGKIFASAGKELHTLLKGINPKELISGLKDTGKAAGDIFKSLVKALPSVIKAIKDFLPVALGIGKWVVDTTAAFADGADQWHDIFNAIGKWFNDTVKAFQQGGGQIADFVKGVVSAFAHGADQLNGFFDGIAGWFRDLVAGFQHGWNQITGFVSTAVGRFQHGAKQIVDFFTGIPDALSTIGGHMVDGLVAGFKGAFSGAVSIFTGLIDLIPAGIRKILGIASPSKVFHLIGTQVGQGLHLGLLGTVDQIKAASQKMIDAVMGKGGWKGTTLGSKMVAAIKKDAKDLEKLSASRDKATAKLSTDQATLANIYAARTQFAQSVKANVMGNADATGIFGTSMDAQRSARQAAKDANAAATSTVVGAAMGHLNGQAYQPSWTHTTAAQMVRVPKVSAHAGLLAVKASLKKLLSDTRKFASNLRALVKLHIDPATYDQLVQAGVAGGGLETSAALLSDPKLAKSIFSLERQVGAAGGTLGRQTAGHEYAGQVKAAKAAVAHDRRALHQVNVTMIVEAKKIDEVSKLIHMVEHVKSTSRKGRKR